MGDQVHRVFIGYDDRQNLAYTTLQHSVYSNCSEPISISPLVLNTLPITRRGLTPFTFSRFLVPWLCNYQGWAIFMDLDVLVLGDLAEVFALRDEQYAIQCVNTKQEFERASMMLINCAHPSNKILTPDFVEKDNKTAFHKLGWLKKDEIGFLPAEWNHIVGTDAPSDDAKLVHYTQGIPCHPEVKGCEYADDWADVAKAATQTKDWQTLMGGSVWAADLGDGRKVAKLDPEHLKLKQTTNDEIAKLKNLAYSKSLPSTAFSTLQKTYAAEQQALFTTPHASNVVHQLMNGQIQNTKQLVDKHKLKNAVYYGAPNLYRSIQVRTVKDATPESFADYLGVSADHSDLGLWSNKQAGNPAELVVSIGVLERCPAEDLMWVIRDMFANATRLVSIHIANFPSGLALPDGRDAHLTQRPRLWWETLIRVSAKGIPNVRCIASVYTPSHENANKISCSTFLI